MIFIPLWCVNRFQCAHTDMLPPQTRSLLLLRMLFPRLMCLLKSESELLKSTCMDYGLVSSGEDKEPYFV